MKELSTLNLLMNNKESLVAKHVPKHCGQRTHEDELNEGQCKNLDRNGMQGIFHVFQTSHRDGRLRLPLLSVAER
jgi:hypothetical protein